MHHLWALFSRDQCQCLRHDVIERLGTQTAAHHQHFERAAAPGKTLGRVWLAQKVFTQRIAHPLACFQCLGKGGKDTVGNACQHLVGSTGHGVLFVQHQLLASQHAHHPAGKGDVAPKAHQHIRLDPTHHGQRLPECLEQTQRQQRQRGQPFAAHATEINGFQRKAIGRHQARFHAVGSAEPVHTPALLTQCLSHGQPREDVPSRAAGHDQSHFFFHILLILGLRSLFS